MKIGIVGWGLETQSAFKFFGPEHEYLIVNESVQDNFPPESDHVRVRYLPNKAPVGIPGQVQDLSYLEGIDQCDKVIYQPTAYFNLKKVFGDNNEFWSKATTAYDIFFENTKSKNIVGVTGSKGKGTTSTLIAKILEAQGEKTHLGGNIGTPILDLLPQIQATDWVVWELANFQLKPASYSPHIAVCLMITEEHLDWHPNFQDYIESKANLFKHQKPEDIAIYFAKDENSKKIVANSPGTKIPYFEAPGAYIRDDGMIIMGDTPIIHRSEVKLLGEHNLQNICAALTAVGAAQGVIGSRANSTAVEWVDKAKVVLSSFSSLEHRLELVRELQGVKYYDDSFATTPDATIVALRAFKEPKILILGGHDKGLAYEPLADEVAGSNVRHAILIGNTANKIASLLKERGFSATTLGLEKMTDIVEKANKLAQPGDVVLLSTASASFGLFEDYKDRGNQFKAAVNSLV